MSAVADGQTKRTTEKRRVHLRGLVSSTTGWTDTARDQGVTETNRGEKTEEGQGQCLKLQQHSNEAHTCFITSHQACEYLCVCWRYFTES